MDEDVWLPLVDEPLGELIAKAQDEDAELAALVGSPRRQLAFRTFAYLRVGILLGRLLMERDLDPGAPAVWVEELLADPAVHREVLAEVRAVAAEVARDPGLADDETLGPDESARARFREFARRLEA
jgi:hypothetical protein